MFTATKIDQLTAGSDLPLKTVQDCVTRLQCNPPTVGCCLGEFELCEKEEELQLSLQRCAEQKLDEQILTPTAFYDFCKKNIVNIEFVYATNEDYEGEY